MAGEQVLKDVEAGSLLVAEDLALGLLFDEQIQVRERLAQDALPVSIPRRPWVAPESLLQAQERRLELPPESSLRVLPPDLLLLRPSLRIAIGPESDAGDRPRLSPRSSHGSRYPVQLA